MAAPLDDHGEEIPVQPLNYQVHLIPNGTIPSVPLPVPQRRETGRRWKTIILWLLYAIFGALILYIILLYDLGAFSGQGNSTTPTAQATHAPHRFTERYA